MKISGILVARATKFCTVKPNIFNVIIVLFFITHKNICSFTGNERKAPGNNIYYLKILASFITDFKHIILNIL